MSINRVAAQKLISEIPTKLRNAARAERKVIINESKKDPVATSIKAAHGQFDFVNNIKLQKKIDIIKNGMALEAYKQKQYGEDFVHRQPTGFIMKQGLKDKVVHASMVL